MIRVQDIYLDYHAHGVVVEALRGVTYDINEGEFVALVGPSGSGKSSLIAATCGLLTPRKGNIYINQLKLTGVSREKRAVIRSQCISMIFQFSEILGRFTVYENFKTFFASSRSLIERKPFQERLDYLNEMLQLSDIYNSFPYDLSGGERQKVAIAAAFLRQTPVILADEPSADLDEENVNRVKTLFQEEKKRGTAILLATHDKDFAFGADTVYRLKNGVIDKSLK